MNSLAIVFSLLISLLLSVIITRWLFRIDHIVNVLEKSANNLEEIKNQNDVLINQQDEIIQLLVYENENR